MRQFSLLLCLLAVAALGWIVGSTERLPSLEQRDAVALKEHLALKAVNKDLKDTSVTTGIRTADAARITCERLSPAIEARPHSTATIASRPNRRVRFELVVIDTGRVVGNLPPYRGSRLIGLD